MYEYTKITPDYDNLGQRYFKCDFCKKKMDKDSNIYFVQQHPNKSTDFNLTLWFCNEVCFNCWVLGRSVV